MRGKLLLVVGLATGYVLGAKAGRGRYDAIKRVSDKFWGDPRVKRQVQKVEGHAKELVKDKAPEVVDFLSDGAKKIVSQASRSKSTPATRSATAAKSASASGK